jgi:Immunoglobulin domain/Immunoglobulin I-set domain
MLSVLSAKSYPGIITETTNFYFVGNNTIIDSFDSSDPHHSDWQTQIKIGGTNLFGTYPTNPMASSFGAPDYATEPYKRKDNAFIGTSGTALTVLNAYLAGYMDTASGGTNSCGNNGIVGDVTYVFNADGTIRSDNTDTIQSGHALNDMPTTFPNATLPAVTWTNLTRSTPTNYVISQTGYWAITNNINGSTGDTHSPVHLSIICKATNAVLWIPTGIDYYYYGDSIITVQSNCNLTIYVGSTNIDPVYNDGRLYLWGSTSNCNQYAAALIIRGLPSCNIIHLEVPGPIAGCIYAPQAAMDFGGGADKYDFIGALTVSNLYVGARLDFHYDEAVGSLFPKLITASPTNRAVSAGSNTTFTVSTTPGSAVAYRWFFNQTNLIALQTNFAGSATNVSLTLTNVQSTNAGNYSVVLSNLAGIYSPLTSSIAVLTVATETPPAIIIQPTNQTVLAGSNVTFTVVASGSPPLSYQWMQWFGPWAEMSGQTNSSLTLTNVTLSQSGSQYMVRVSNTVAVVSSSTAVLTVVGNPAILIQPTNQTVLVGSNATFSVVASGTAPLNYQWAFFTGAGWLPLSGETNSSFTLTNVQETRIYMVLVSNTVGAVQSSNAVLTVLAGPPPVILTQPGNQYVHVGDTATFSVTVTGASPFSYRWFSYQWAGPWYETGTTNTPTWTISSVHAINTGIYHVIVTNAFGCVTSSWAHLVVYTNLPAIDTANIFTQGGFQIHITGDPGLSCAVQSSTNFFDWMPLYTNFPSFYFTDVTSNLFPYRFYRVAVVPWPPFDRP